MKNTSRITRSQPQGRAIPPTIAKKQPKCTPRLSTIIQEKIIIHPERQRTEGKEDSNLNQKVDALTAANRKLEDSLKFIMDKFQFVQQDIESIRKENAALKAENTVLRKDIAVVLEDMDYLMCKVDRIDQKILSKNVEISGVPALKDEDLSDVLQELFREINFDSAQTTVTDAFRLKENNKSGLPGAIIVTFNSNREKNQFLFEAKRKQLTSSFLSTTHRQRPVYVNEHLTRLNKYLFYLARTMRRQGSIKYAWTDNGRVLVKEAEGKPTIIVECPKTLNNLKQQTDK